MKHHGLFKAREYDACKSKEADGARRERGWGISLARPIQVVL